MTFLPKPTWPTRWLDLAGWHLSGKTTSLANAAEGAAMSVVLFVVRRGASVAIRGQATPPSNKLNVSLVATMVETDKMNAGRTYAFKAN
jgi:hypothetical protein